MSLTSLLKVSNSPVYSFMRYAFPLFCEAGTRGNRGKDVALGYNFDVLMSRELLFPIPDGVESRKGHASQIGTAFDYRARSMLGDFDPQRSIAAIGLKFLQDDALTDADLVAPSIVLTQAFEIASERASAGSAADLDLYCLVLAMGESIARGGVYMVMDGKLGDQLRDAGSGNELLDSIDPLKLLDMESLRLGAEDQIFEWRTSMGEGLALNPNPTFQGSPLVGGADADWMIGDTLIECKTTESIANYRIRDFVLQLLGYALLDFDDALGIRSVGVWMPRRPAFQSWTLDEIIGSSAESVLPELRKKFRWGLEQWREEKERRRKAFAEEMGLLH